MMQQSSSIKIRKTFYVRLVAVLVVLTFPVFGIFLLSVLPSSPSAMAEVAIGGRMRSLVIITPAQGTGSQDVFTVFHAYQIPPSDLVRRATRRPLQIQSSRLSAFTYTQLTHEQWQRIDTLRAAWCRDLPTYARMPGVNQKPVYDVGLNCSTGHELIYKRVKVPIGHLPAPFRMVLEVVPVPVDPADDPYPWLLHPS